MNLLDFLNGMLVLCASAAVLLLFLAVLLPED